jgi:hypothetical protein
MILVTLNVTRTLKITCFVAVAVHFVEPTEVLLSHLQDTQLQQRSYPCIHPRNQTYHCTRTYGWQASSKIVYELRFVAVNFVATLLVARVVFEYWDLRYGSG